MCTNTSEDTFWVYVSPFTMWILGLELRLLGLVEVPLHAEPSPAPHPYLKKFLRYFCDIDVGSWNLLCRVDLEFTMIFLPLPPNLCGYRQITRLCFMSLDKTVSQGPLSSLP